MKTMSKFLVRFAYKILSHYGIEYFSPIHHYGREYDVISYDYHNDPNGKNTLTVYAVEKE